MSESPLQAPRAHPRLRRQRRRARPQRVDPRGRVHGDRRPERVRQVDAAARARPHAQAARGVRAARRRGDLVAADEAGGAPARAAAADLDRARRDHGRGPRRARPPSLPAAPAPVVAGGRPGGPGGDGADRRRRRSPTGSSTSSPAASASASGWRWRSRSRRRCCCSTSRHLPRHRPPDGGARPVRRAAPQAAARSSPCSTTSTTPAATRHT